MSYAVVWLLPAAGAAFGAVTNAAPPRGAAAAYEVVDALTAPYRGKMAGFQPAGP